MSRTYFEKVTQDPKTLALTLLHFFDCDPGMCDVCGHENDCPLYGKDWRSIRYKHEVMVEMAYRFEDWLNKEIEL